MLTKGTEHTPFSEDSQTSKYCQISDCRRRKVDPSTDQLISHAAHFLGKAKKDLVDAAVREYIDAHRAEINAGVREVLTQLDGSSRSAISLLTDIPADQLDRYGGLPNDPAESSQ